MHRLKAWRDGWKLAIWGKKEVDERLKILRWRNIFTSGTLTQRKMILVLQPEWLRIKLYSFLNVVTSLQAKVGLTNLKYDIVLILQKNKKDEFQRLWKKKDWNGNKKQYRITMVPLAKVKAKKILLTQIIRKRRLQLYEKEEETTTAHRLTSLKLLINILVILISYQKKGQKIKSPRTNCIPKRNVF